MADRIGSLLESVARARASGTPLAIAGNGSKAHLGRRARGHVLSVAGHSGVVDYEPTELVVSARAGTTLTRLDAVLAEHRQCLAADPPRYGGRATLGGTLACNLSGPARPWAGSLRDHVLGLRLINGRAEHLRFGGRVMKNVAGYDVSRLQAGAFGVLGVMTEITLRVQPRPETEATRMLEIDAAGARARMLELGRRNLPLSAACWVDGRLFIRLSGADAAVSAAAASTGGEPLADSSEFWASLREQRLGFFEGDEPLWRFALPAGAPLALPDRPWLLDWGGAQRYLRGAFALEELEALARSLKGEVSLIRGGDRSGEVLHARDAAQKRAQLSLKAAFDPDGIFNPGRLYSWL